MRRHLQTSINIELVLLDIAGAFIAGTPSSVISHVVTKHRRNDEMPVQHSFSAPVLTTRFDQYCTATEL